jgi:hypothetical protein
MSADEIHTTLTSESFTSEGGPPSRGVLDIGTVVCVCDRYLGNWSSGFEVAEVLADGYRLRRLTDRRVFPDVFAFDDVRRERRINPGRHLEGSSLDRRQFP